MDRRPVFLQELRHLPWAGAVERETPLSVSPERETARSRAAPPAENPAQIKFLARCETRALATAVRAPRPPAAPDATPSPAKIRHRNKIPTSPRAPATVRASRSPATMLGKSAKSASADFVSAIRSRRPRRTA